MNPESIFGDALNGIVGEMVASAIVSTAIAAANGSAVEVSDVISRATDKEWVDAAPRGTDTEKAVCRAFAWLADEIGCPIDTVQMFHDAGIRHGLIVSGFSNYVLMAHVRNGYTVMLPDGSPMDGVRPNGEKVDLRQEGLRRG